MFYARYSVCNSSLPCRTFSCALNPAGFGALYRTRAEVCWTWHISPSLPWRRLLRLLTRSLNGKVHQVSDPSAGHVQYISRSLPWPPPLSPVPWSFPRWFLSFRLHRARPPASQPLSSWNCSLNCTTKDLIRELPLFLGWGRGVNFSEGKLRELDNNL